MSRSPVLRAGSGLVGLVVVLASVLVGSLTSPLAGAVVPVTEVVVVVDVSGSMSGAPLAAAKDAVTTFVTRLPADIAVGLVVFGPRPVVLAAPSSDRAAVLGAVATLEAGGETALYDALVTIARDLPSLGDPSSRAVVLLSDGGDTVSSATLSDALNVAATLRVEVIELASPESSQPALAAIASSGGGSIATVADLGALAATYEQTAGNLFADPGAADSSSISSGTTSTVDPAPAVDGPQPPRLPVVAVAAGGRDLGVGSALVVLAAATVLATLASGVGGRTERLRRLAAAGIVVPGVEAAGRAKTGPTQLIGDLLLRSGRRTSLQRALERAGSGLTPEGFVLRVAALAAVVTALSVLIVGPVAIVVLPASPFAARAWLVARATSRRNRFLAALPDLLQVIVAMLRSGYGFLQALDAVGAEADEPARSEVRRVLLEVRAGRDLADALGAMAVRLDAPDLTWVVDAVEINQTVGGDLARVLETVATTIRERQRLRRQVSALTAEGRVSAYVMMGLPPGVAAALAVMNPAYFARLTEGVGLVLLGGAGVSLLVGYLWMRRMIGSVQ